MIVKSISKWLSEATTQLKDAGIESGRLDAELLLSCAIDKPRTYLHAHSDEQLDTATIKKADEMLVQRCNHVPIAYIFGFKQFYGRDFAVTHDTLIPRPETEVLIELSKKYSPGGAKILDIGTGSGAIGITLQSELPSATITLSDISEPALNVARKNANRLLDKTLHVVKSDLLQNWIGRTDFQYDMIVANLPYVGRDWDISPETTAEPDLALFADDNGLHLMEKLITQAADILKPGSYLILEMDTRQVEPITEFADNHEFDVIETHPFTIVLLRKQLLVTA